jgi:hypothetical protein
MRKAPARCLGGDRIEKSGTDAVGAAVAKTRMDKRRALAFPVNGFLLRTFGAS